LLNELGLKPDVSKSRLSSETKTLMMTLNESGWAQVLSSKPDRIEITQLQQYLHGFLIYHLGKIPKGRAAALSMELT